MSSVSFESRQTSETTSKVAGLSTTSSICSVLVWLDHLYSDTSVNLLRTGLRVLADRLIEISYMCMCAGYARLTL